jgi:hypothetical protein
MQALLNQLQPIQIPLPLRVFIGGNSGAVYINGNLYHFIYNPRNPRRRVTPDDVRRLPMDALEATVSPIILARPGEPVTVFRLRFSRAFQFEGNGYDDHLAFVALSDRNRTVRRINAPRRHALMLLEQSRLVREAVDGEDACFICLQNFPDASFLPCGNGGICCACAYRIVQTTKSCPLCRGDVVSFQRNGV